MIKRQYLFDVEVWEGGQCVEWANISTTFKSWFVPTANDFTIQAQNYISEKLNCRTKDIRIKGVFKL